MNIEPTEPQTTEPAAASTEPTEPAPQGDQTRQQEPAAQAPWERDGEQFDPEKAWNLIQHLRDENKSVKDRNRELEDEKLTKQQRMERDLKEANDKLADYERRNAWAEARAEHPLLTDEDMELIGAGTPDEIRTKAAKLAARLEAQAAPRANTNQPDASNPMLMKPTPTGGNDPTAGDSGMDWIREGFNNL